MNRPMKRLAVYLPITFAALIAARAWAAEPTPATLTPASPTVANPKNNPADCQKTIPGQPSPANCAKIPDTKTAPSTTTPSKLTKTRTTAKPDEMPSPAPTDNCAKTPGQPTPSLPPSASQCPPSALDKSAPNKGGQYGH